MPIPPQATLPCTRASPPFPPPSPTQSQQPQDEPKVLAGGNLDPTNPVPGIENPEAQEKAKDMGGSGEGGAGDMAREGQHRAGRRVGQGREGRGCAVPLWVPALGC